MSRNLFVTLFSEATTHNTSHDAHTTRTQTIPSSNAMSSKKARARKKKREKREREKRERDAITSEAIPGLPDHLVVAHVLRSEQSDDPADLARLPAVSHAMRGAVAKTGLRFEQLGEWEAVNLGCLSAVKRLQRGGRLSRRERLCQAAARSGQLEELKVSRTAARGTRIRARMRRLAGNSRSCSGHAQTPARGARVRVCGRRSTGISRCCSGCARTAARGTSRRAHTRRRAGTSKCCSGHARTVARGTSTRARRRLTAGTPRCCNGRTRTAARGTQRRASTRRVKETGALVMGADIIATFYSRRTRTAAR